MIQKNAVERLSRLHHLIVCYVLLTDHNTLSPYEIWQDFSWTGFRRKKTLCAHEQRRTDVAQQREDWRKTLSKTDASRLVFPDETGAKTNMTRTFARSKRGERAVDHVPQGHWNTTTLVAGITHRSAIAPMVLDGPMTTAAFEAYLAQVLATALPVEAIVVMDNLSAHKSPRIAKSVLFCATPPIQSALFLPSYCRELNPSEDFCFHPLHQYLEDRCLEGRSYSTCPRSDM